MKKEEEIIYTIEELYKWACENKKQDYTVLIENEGVFGNIHKSQIIVYKDEEIVLL